MKTIQALGLSLLIVGTYAKCQSGYTCCKSCDVVATDADGDWGVENNQWCGIDTEKCKKSNAAAPGAGECWSKALGYDCCKTTTEVAVADESGKWGVENGQWCGIIDSAATEDSCGAYPCCKTCDSVFEDADGKWGVENNDWCLIKKSCGKESAATTTKATKPTSGNDKPASGGTRTTLANGGILESGIFTTLPPSHTQPPYPHAENTGLASCGAKWTMVDNVCVAMYCEDDLTSENCDECGGVAGKDGCVSVDPALCILVSGQKFTMLETNHGNTLDLLTSV